MQVQNDSYWYRARRDIGGALHLQREVEQVTGDAASHFSRGVGFEGFFYVKKANKDGDVVATRVSAGTAPTAVKAWNLADNACRVRDSNPADMHSPGLQGRDLLGTHFQAIVISLKGYGPTALILTQDSLPSLHGSLAHYGGASENSLSRLTL